MRQEKKRETDRTVLKRGEKSGIMYTGRIIPKKKIIKRLTIQGKKKKKTNQWTRNKFEVKVIDLNFGSET